MRNSGLRPPLSASKQSQFDRTDVADTPTQLPTPPASFASASMSSPPPLRPRLPSVERYASLNAGRNRSTLSPTPGSAQYDQGMRMSPEYQSSREGSPEDRFDNMNELSYSGRPLVRGQTITPQSSRENTPEIEALKEISPNPRGSVSQLTPKGAQPNTTEADSYNFPSRQRIETKSPSASVSSHTSWDQVSEYGRPQDDPTSRRYGSRPRLDPDTIVRAYNADKHTYASKFRPHSEVRQPERMKTIFRTYSDTPRTGCTPAMGGYALAITQTRSSPANEQLPTPAASQTEQSENGESYASDDGIPSYTSMLGTGTMTTFDRTFQRMPPGWRIDGNGEVVPATSPVGSAVLESNRLAGTQLAKQVSAEDQASLSQQYIGEFKSQFHTLLQKIKTPLVSFILTTIAVAVLGVFVMIVPGARDASTYPPIVDFPGLMNIEASFETIVDSALSGASLAMDIKSSAMAVADLSTTVKYSTLKCADSLSVRLGTFADGANGNIRSLHAFSSKVGGTLESLVGVNEYTLRKLNEIENYKPSWFKRSICRIPGLCIFFFGDSAPRIEPIFDEAVRVLAKNLFILQTDGEAIISALEELSDQHKEIHEEIVRENSDLKKEKGEIMSSLWTVLGRNSQKLQDYQETEGLLKKIEFFEDRARQYVAAALFDLGRMAADLEDLRRRVSEPILAGTVLSRGMSIPLKEHIKAVRQSVERLRRSKGHRLERLQMWNKLMIPGHTLQDFEQKIVINPELFGQDDTEVMKS